MNEHLKPVKTENADAATRSQCLIDVFSKTADEVLPEKRKQVTTGHQIQDDDFLNELPDTRSGECRGSKTQKTCEVSKKIP